ncbi:hypothetical protein [Streptomyces sp. NPDC048142]|uniref:hypothetical protein n=1 Tax=Streptomyces sp. NPDC048142 TaxID=3365501 RepID=UPI00371D57E6
METTLGERLLLLSPDDESRVAREPANAASAIAGASLVELAIAGRIARPLPTARSLARPLNGFRKLTAHAGVGRRAERAIGLVRGRAAAGVHDQPAVRELGNARIPAEDDFAARYSRAVS